MEDAEIGSKTERDCGPGSREAGSARQLRCRGLRRHTQIGSEAAEDFFTVK